MRYVFTFDRWKLENIINILICLHLIDKHLASVNVTCAVNLVSVFTQTDAHTHAHKDASTHADMHHICICL